MEKKIENDRDRLEAKADPEQITMTPVEGRTGVEDTSKLSNIQLRAPGMTAEQYPTNAFQSHDKRDIKEEAKLGLVQEGKKLGLGDGVTPFGRAELTDEDISWLKSKKDKESYANFQQWFATNFDKMNEAEKAYAREAFPTFYRERINQLHKSCDLQRRIAELKLMGIRSREDMILSWAIESGYIKADPLEHILHPEQASSALKKEEQQKRFRRGLLNPKARGRGDWGLVNRTKNAMTLTGQAGSATSQYGTNNSPFSVFGNVNAGQEREVGTGALFQGILKGDPSFINAAVGGGGGGGVAPN